MATTRLLALLLVASVMAAPYTALASHSTSNKTCRARAATLCGPSSFTFYMTNTVYNPAVENTVFNSVYGALPNFSFPNPFSFGVTSTFEDPVLSGPSNTSQQIGLARGIWQINSFTEYVLFYIFTANITEGPYQGTINLLGLLREVDPVRYLSVIGGTGDFLAARGQAVNRLVSIDRVPPATFTLSFDLDLYY